MKKYVSVKEAKADYEDLIPAYTYSEFLKELKIPRMSRKQKKKYKKEYNKFLEPKVIAQLKEIKDKSFDDVLEENRISGRYDVFMNCLDTFLGSQS